ncbi:MAG TPA: glycoside hydrolase family 75 protein [Terriglobales bacterium]|nr:glycoside hydrolase family 75 protein [Terriglobales bacterium]
MKSKFAGCVIAFAITCNAQTPQSFRKSKLFRHRSTTVWRCSSSTVDALAYQAGMAIDADGAYRAYHPSNRLGLDTIEHAGHPGDWWALATDNGKPGGHPVVQHPGDPAPGYYVSMTALFDPDISDERNPRRFVDAATIPYVVLPPEGFKYAHLGDFATVVNLQNGKAAGAIVADESAPRLQMGEGSIALANTLAVDSNPRTGGAEQGIVYVIYPGSGNGKPRSANAIASISQAKFTNWGGLRRLRTCLASAR